MRAIGIILAGGNNHRMKELSQKRAIAAMPVAGSYRSIDFALSNMTNSRIQRVAVFTQYNAKSLNEHLSSSKWWDFGRKQGGLSVFTPTVTSENSSWYRGTADAIYQNLDFLKESHEPYVVIASGDCVYKMDFNKVLEYHIAHKAGITLICTASSHGKVMVSAGEDGRMWEATRGGEGEWMFNNMYIINRQLLIQLVIEAASLNQYSFVDTCLIQKGRELPIYCYRYDGFCRAADSMQSYFDISMCLLDPAVRSALFPMDRPVYTRVQDEVPVKYGLSAAVSNSLVADGCIIEGRVENCIVFRGVRIGHGAVVKNSIIMQGSYIGNGADLDYCICDKGVLVADNRRLAGYATYPLYIPRDTRV